MRILVSAVVAVMLLLATASVAFSSVPRYGQRGWEGYGWPAATRVSADFRVPRVSGPAGTAVAFWAGFGKGDPGIQQVGVTAIIGHGWTSWWEMWESQSSVAHPFNASFPVWTGDLMQFIATRSSLSYTLTVNNVTRHWHQAVIERSWLREPGGEAVAEAFGPDLPDYAPAVFLWTSGNPGSAGSWTFPFGGSRRVKLSSASFYDRRP